MSHQCILHHNLWLYIGNCILLQSSSPWGPGLWPYQHLFEAPVTSEVGLNTMLAAGAFDAFPQALNIWDCYVSHTGSSPGEGGCLTVTTGGTGVL